MQYLRGRDGQWRYEFEAVGKRYTGSGYETKRAARDAEMIRRREVAAEVPSQSQTLTLADYVQLWLSDHVKVECRERTLIEYRSSLERHVLPQLGQVALRDVTRSQLRELLTNLSLAGLSRNTVKNVLIPLRACLTRAVEDGLLDTNPATALGRRVRARTEREGRRVQVFTKEQLARLLEAVSPHDNLGDLVHLLARSGLRLGEALGLKGRDLGRDAITVRRSLQWTPSGPKEYAPKGGTERIVDIPQDLSTRLYMARGEDDHYVIGAGVEPVRAESLRKAWHTLLERLDLPPLRLHDLRHTYASLLLAAGAPLLYVRDQLGHASIQITADTYGHLVPGTNRGWIDKAGF